MVLLAKLLLAHFIGDFIVQPEKWVVAKESKKASSKELYFHAVIHGLLVFLLLWDLNLWYIALIIIVVHLIIDLVKVLFQKVENKTRWFFYDQGMHFLSIFFIWHFINNSTTNILNELLKSESFWIYVTAVLFITFVTGVFIQNLLKGWTESFLLHNNESLNNAGKYIGILERLLVFIFVITNHWEAIGFLLAAKSVFRFGDLKEGNNRKLTEYVLIGTLLSFGSAILIGMLIST